MKGISEKVLCGFLAIFAGISVACLVLADEPSGGGRFTEYQYDEAGRVIGVITVVDESPPLVTHIEPAVIRRGPAVATTIYGSGLRQAQIESDHAGLSVSGVTSSATWVTLQLTADESVPLGTRTLTLTTTLGSDSVEVEVYPRLPVIQVSPDPAALSPGAQVVLEFGIDSVDVIDHVFQLSSSNPSIADVVPAMLLIEAGQLQPQEAVIVSATVLGNASLRFETDEIVNRVVPLYVTEPWQPPAGGIDFFSKPVGVYVGEPPSPPRLIEYGPFVSRLGVVMPETPGLNPESIGPLVASPVGVNVGSVLEGLTPSSVVRGAGVVAVTASGSGLDGVVAVEFVPPDDVAVTLGSVSPDGTSLNLSVEADELAALGERQLRFLTGTGQSLPPAGRMSDRLRVTDPVPAIESVAPLYLVRGDENIELTVRGRLLGEVEQVQLLPGDDIVVGSVPQIAPDGQSLRIDLTVAGDASLGPRSVVVTSPAGSSDSKSTAYNTVEITTGVADTIAPIAAPLLGVVLGEVDDSAAYPVDVTSTGVGITVGAAIDAMMPASGGVGTEVAVDFSGVGLQAATNLRFEPDDGILVSDWASTPEGDALTAQIVIDSGAPRTLRRVVVETEGGVVPSSGAFVDRFLVTEQLPRIDSIDPLLLTVPSGPTSVRLRGRHLQEALAVELSPSDDVKLGVPQSAGDGAWVDVDVTVLPTAELGPRTFVVHTPAGPSEASTSVANRVHLVEGIDYTVTPLMAPLVGVNLGEQTPIPPTQATQMAALVGVHVYVSPEPEFALRDIRSNLLGMTVGPAVTSIQPHFLPVDGEHEISISGFALADVTGVVFEPPQGITIISGPDAALDGASVALTVMVEPDAAQTTRRVSWLAEEQTLPVAAPEAGTVQVVGTEPMITSISPIQAIAGETVSLVVRGFNLFGVSAVSATPSSGLTFDVNPQNNASGTEVTVNVTIATDAQAGPRAIQVHAAGGVTPAEPTSANTLNILGQ